MSTHGPNVAREAAARTRRAFLTLGASAGAAYGGWAWLRSRKDIGELDWPLRSVLGANEAVAEKYFSNGHRSPEFTASQVTAARVNGDVGLDDDFDFSKWVLNVTALDKTPDQQITLAQIKALPRVEQTTQLNCIEGWTTVVNWVGVKFSDFTDKYAPQGRSRKYVSMSTPEEDYYVGLDTASAMHPQTLLCYEMNGEPLTSKHGAPLRLVIPVKYGVKNIKRIGSITYTNERPQDYWANYGYDWYAGL